MVIALKAAVPENHKIIEILLEHIYLIQCYKK